MFAAGLLLILAAVAYALSQSGAGAYMGSLFGGLSIREDEMPILSGAASAHNVDPRFLAALRLTENGGPGRELGVLSVPAPTVVEQYDVAARTISRNLDRYESSTGMSPIGNGGVYTPDFVAWFSGVYAPRGASNDPTNLNANHAGNLLTFYRKATGSA